MLIPPLIWRYPHIRHDLNSRRLSTRTAFLAVQSPAEEIFALWIRRPSIAHRPLPLLRGAREREECGVDRPKALRAYSAALSLSGRTMASAPRPCGRRRRSRDRPWRSWRRGAAWTWSAAPPTARAVLSNSTCRCAGGIMRNRLPGLLDSGRRPRGDPNGRPRRRPAAAVRRQSGLSSHSPLLLGQ